MDDVESCLPGAQPHLVSASSILSMESERCEQRAERCWHKPEHASNNERTLGRERRTTREDITLNPTNKLTKKTFHTWCVRAGASEAARRRTRAYPRQSHTSIRRPHRRQYTAGLRGLARNDEGSQRGHIIMSVSALLITCLSLLADLKLSPGSPSSISSVLAFNVDTQSAVVHQGPAGSYFGYSVAQHRDRGTNWLLVGAPKAQTDQAKTKEAGAVYKCAPNSSKACKQIPFDPNGSSMFHLLNETKQSDEKSYQWFGASLQSANESGSIVACAPRYVYFSTNLKRRDPVGTCWVSRGSFDGFLEYSPCRLNEQWGHHNLGSCQAGFSAAITKDGSRLFMGAPGSHVWQGQVFAHNLRTDLTNSTRSVNPRSEDDSYLGYSMALGRFSASTSSPTASSSETDVALGMPRGADLAGKIVIVDREMRTLKNLTGEQMGSYFGYSLATADVNGDGLDDLIVGAPLYYNQTTAHKEPHYERGRIYVALQNARHELNIMNRIDGHKNRARFGTALANCGDLNRDGFQDVAVGAPYDGPEGRGAVYIFMGRKSGLSEEWDQVIYAENVRNEGNYLRSFGFSLSGGLDLDGNQYPDLLAGDPQGDRAILFKTRPVVNVTATIAFQPEHFNLDDKTCLLPNSSTSVSCITVQYCIKYTGVNLDTRLPFVFDIKLDTENKGAPRLFFLNNQGKNEERNSSTLSNNTNQCRAFKAYIVRQVRDKLTPLKVDIEYNLADYTGDTYDYQNSAPRLKPILNKSVANKISKVASIQKNCGPDNVCVPDLKLTMNPNIDQYTIGSDQDLVLDITVKNYGEDAFESMFYLTMPMSINYNTYNKSRPDNPYPICSGPKPDQTGVNVLTCDLGNPQVRNEVVKFSVITKPAKGMFTEPDFTFVASVNSTNPEQDDRHREDNQVAVGIPIKVEVNLVLSGSSTPPSVVHNSTPYNRDNGANSNSVKLVETDLGPEVYHKYQLHNKGPSTINDIALTILWPTKTKDGKYLLYLVDEPKTSEKVRCKPVANDVINPLKLKYLRGNSINLPGSSKTSNGNQAVVVRNKRQADASQQQTSQQNSDQLATTTTTTTTTTVDNSIFQQLNLLTCGPTQCDRFECNVFDLGNNEIATIEIRSRLYEETLNYLSLQDFDISSKLVAQVKSLPYNVSSQSMQPYQEKAETQVHTTGLAVQYLIPWWLYLLAILLGIGLFILLAWFLKYLGFFARRRPPKGAEREPLTPTVWNDYQYTPGDTAL